MLALLQELDVDQSKVERAKSSRTARLDLLMLASNYDYHVEDCEPVIESDFLELREPPPAATATPPAEAPAPPPQPAVGSRSTDAMLPEPDSQPVAHPPAPAESTHADPPILPPAAASSTPIALPAPKPNPPPASASTPTAPLNDEVLPAKVRAPIRHSAVRATEGADGLNVSSSCTSTSEEQPPEEPSTPPPAQPPITPSPSPPWPVSPSSPTEHAAELKPSTSFSRLDGPPPTSAAGRASRVTEARLQRAKERAERTRSGGSSPPSGPSSPTPKATGGQPAVAADGDRRVFRPVSPDPI